MMKAGNMMGLALCVGMMASSALADDNGNGRAFEAQLARISHPKPRTELRIEGK